MLKRISRILRRPNVASVEKGFPIFQLQKKQKLLFLEVFKSLFILCYLCSMLDSPGRFFSIRWSTLFQSLENLGKMPLLLPLHAVRFSLSLSLPPIIQSSSGLYYNLAASSDCFIGSSTRRSNPEAKQSWNIVEEIRVSQVSDKLKQLFWMKILIFRLRF